MRKLLLFTILFVVWLIFSGFFDAFFIICGILSCAISVYFAVRMAYIAKGKPDKNRIRYPVYLKLSSMGYYLWLFKEIIFSSFTVARFVWQLSPKISPEFGQVKTNQKSDIGIATYANSITLTPGTTCTDVKGDILFIHALTKEGVEDLQTNVMNDKIYKYIN